MRLPESLVGWTCASLLLVCVACGTPGAPQPPSLQLPRPVDDLAGARKGTRVVLSWTPPEETTDKQTLRHIGATRVCRALNEFPMAQCRDVVAELKPSEMTSQEASGRKPKVAYEDVIAPTAMGANRFASYAIEVFNDRGRSAGLSNQVRVPLAPTLPAPVDLRAVVTPEGVILHWTGISRSQLGPELQNYEFRYRVYRKTEGKTNYSLIEEVPLNGPEMTVPDKSFEWERTYDYKVASVTLLPQAAARSQSEVEGDDSPVVRVTVHDIFPPARPSGLQAVFSGVGQKPFIDLSWDPNSESDLQGYLVFRREGGQQPVALNKEPVRAPSYRDENVQPGHKYTYFVRAIDVRGNASEPSPETSETVPEKF
jgi:hypothetical protein